MELLVNISLGELVDKITILEIKAGQIKDKDKLVNVNKELNVLTGVLNNLKLPENKLTPFSNQLKRINQVLWKIEDDIRDKEAAKEFDDAFVELARLVYITNDQRAKVKKDINLAFGSALIEEKSYQAY